MKTVRELASLFLLMALAVPLGKAGAPSLRDAGAPSSLQAGACSTAAQVHAQGVEAGWPDEAWAVLAVAAPAPPPVAGQKGPERTPAGLVGSRCSGADPSARTAWRLRARASGAFHRPLPTGLLGFRAHPSTAPPDAA